MTNSQVETVMMTMLSVKDDLSTSATEVKFPAVNLIACSWYFPDFPTRNWVSHLTMMYSSLIIGHGVKQHTYKKKQKMLFV